LSARTYRSKLELFRDVLVATRYASKRTRIIGLANLNPGTFQKHMSLASAHGLVRVEGGDFRLTERAEPVLVAVQDLLTRSHAIDGAVKVLDQSLHSPGEGLRADGSVLHHVSRIAWAEIQRLDKPGPVAYQKSGGLRVASPGSSAGPMDLLDVLAAMRGGSQPAGGPGVGSRDSPPPPAFDPQGTSRRGDSWFPT
jgi:predicted transcriptional regulator